MAPVIPLVTDPHLRSVIDAADQACQYALQLTDLLEQNPPPSSESTTDPTTLVDPSVEDQCRDLQTKLAYTLAIVRKGHRDASLEVRNTKQATADARHEIDSLHLHLQNLLYEERHLLSEIHAADSYVHKYISLPLIPLSQFLEEFPEMAAEGSKSEHEVMVARIEHEHNVRRDMEARRQELLKRKQELVKENLKRKERMDRLVVDVEKFTQAAEPIEKAFAEDI
jgi:THO complex subunit 5